MIENISSLCVGVTIAVIAFLKPIEGGLTSLLSALVTLYQTSLHYSDIIRKMLNLMQRNGKIIALSLILL